MGIDTKGRIAVALSGGVDSAVTAALLLEDGWEVIGATLQLYAEPNGQCELGESGESDGLGTNAAEAPEKARIVAEHLGIRHFVVDRVGYFEKTVLRRAWDEYAQGRTPCPCMICNERVKFGALLGWALKNDCRAIATGHYARLCKKDGEIWLLRGQDSNKDQSYFLAGLSQQQLQHTVFPLGGLEKTWVREKAAQIGLPLAGTKESQDVCFLRHGMSFQETLLARFGKNECQGKSLIGGHIVDWNGKRLAHHDGIHNFTIGQRRGVKVGTGAKAWVCRLDAETGNVHLTNDEKNLLREDFSVAKVSWTCRALQPLPLKCEVQVRYRAKPASATLFEEPSGRIRVILDESARAVAPGQAAVFYDGDRALGRGWIE